MERGQESAPHSPLYSCYFWLFKFYFNKVQKCDVIKKYICESMGFVRIF